MEVKRVITFRGCESETLAGTTPNVSNRLTKPCCPRVASKKKIRALTAMSP
jgi:hypothetical protein